MGNKSGRTGNYIVYFIAAGCLAAVVNLVACGPVQNKFAEIRSQQHLQEYREDLAEGFFETVIAKSKQVIEENETSPPADSALYALGEVYAHHDYQGRDYLLSKYYFEKLIENFPDSELSSEAKTYLNLLQTIQEGDREREAATEQPVAVVSEKKLVADSDFQEAVQKNLLILKEAGKKQPADEALYNLGLLYAHGDNPAKDYRKSQLYLHVLTKQFPESKFAEEAAVILSLFETIDKMQQIDREIEQQKKQLNQ